MTAAPTLGRTVLLVEDDGVALPLRCVLERAGHRVERVDRLSGTDRDGDHVALVVVDVEDVDLQGLVDEVRTSSRGAPLLLLTQGPGRQDAGGQLVPDVALLPKPFALAEFQACLRVLMGQTATQVPAARVRSECDAVGPQTVVGQVPQNVV